MSTTLPLLMNFLNSLKKVFFFRHKDLD